MTHLTLHAHAGNGSAGGTALDVSPLSTFRTAIQEGIPGKSQGRLAADKVVVCLCLLTDRLHAGLSRTAGDQRRDQSDQCSADDAEAGNISADKP